MKGKDELKMVFDPEKEAFMIGESSLDFFVDKPRRQSIGVILLCLSGEAELWVNMNKCRLTEGMQVIILPNTICMISEKTNNFNVLFFSFSEHLFQEAAFRLSSDYFGFLQENFYVLLPQEAFQINVAFLRMSEIIYLDRENRFREKIAVNFLQNYLLNSYDKIYRAFSQVEIKEADRKNKLFKQFVLLVHEYCKTQREVSFYANELSISTRYLSAIVRKNTQKSAKEFIDECVMQEIKLLLHSVDLSIQQIADRLDFPDQSYLGRYFKKHTGISPKEYRKR